jgi:predicted transcriptional regulator YheO
MVKYLIFKSQDVMKLESPITWEKQIEIAKELSEKGIFDDTNLPISLRS